MTCFLEGKVCENKTIHLISSAQLSSRKYAYGVRCISKERTACGCGSLQVAGLPLSISALQYGVIYRLCKGALISSCRPLIRTLKMTGLSTDSCSTLLATGFQVLLNPSSCIFLPFRLIQPKLYKRLWEVVSKVLWK